MRTSDQTNELWTALAKAQGAFPAIPKAKTVTVQTRERGSYSYAYADLPAILDAVRGPLAANGLCVTQAIDHGEALVLITRLAHSSGQWCESIHPLRHYERPQEFGSALTFARRYALTALLGVAAEDDDDASAAQDAKPAPPPEKPAPPKLVAKPAPPKVLTADEIPRQEIPPDVRRLDGHVIDLGKTTGTSPKSGKPYTRYVARLDTSEDRYVTFDTRLGGYLEDSRDAGLPCTVFAVPAKKDGWWDIKDVHLHETEADAAVADDEPLPF